MKKTDKIFKYLGYTIIKLIVGLAMLWFFVDYLVLPISNTLTRLGIWLIWIVISYSIYDKTIFQGEALTVEACKSFIAAQEK